MPFDTFRLVHWYPIFSKARLSNAQKESAYDVEYSWLTHRIRTVSLPSKEKSRL